MSSADGSIRFLVKNIEQLQGLGRLEAILPIMEAMKVLLTETQFDVSMVDLTMSSDNRAIARRFLVDGATTAELKKAGVSPSRLSKVVARVITNFHKQIESLDLVSGHYVLDAKTAELVQALEIGFIGQLSTRHVAAITFTFPVTMILSSISLGIGIGTSSVIARSIGGGDQTDARHLGTHAIILVSVTMAILSLIGWLTIDPVFLALGAPPAAVVAFEITLSVCSLFTHANIRLPVRADRLVSLVVVTPSMHWRHHGVLADQHGNNFGFCLSLWDRLFDTYRTPADQAIASLKLGQNGMERCSSGIRVLLSQPLVAPPENRTQ